MQRTTKRVVIGLAIGVPVLLGGAAVVAALSAVGTFNGWAHRAPSVHSSEVEAARQAARHRLDAETAQVVGLVGAEPLATGMADGCDYGQHNWKVQDDWAMRCSSAVDMVLPGGAVPTFRTDAAQLHERLAAAGWTSRFGLDIPDVLTSYWAGHGGTGYGRLGRPYAPGDLPAASYNNVEGDELSIEWLSTDSDTLVGATAQFSETVVDNRPVDAPALAASTPPGAFRVRVTITATYWDE